MRAAIAAAPVGDDQHGDDAYKVVARARERGVLINAFGARTIGVVTHLDVSREQCARAAEILVDVID
jgi:threonine aldolase